MRKWTNKVLADKITWLFERNEMLGGATSKDMYDVTLKALKDNNKEDINIMLEYFELMKDTGNEDVRDIYFELIEIMENKTV